MNEQRIAECFNNLFVAPTDNYIFIYTPPKVGSTTLVTSLRVSLGKSFNTIHIHDEIMLSVLTGINSIKINDLLKYLADNGKNVYVIDIYRTPIERKMLEFFEKISSYHFNNNAENISKYSIKRITDRFNKIFPHIENGDHYFEKYDILEPISFDFDKKYSIQVIKNIKYIKLRLCDSNLWGSILSNIFQSDIVIINDYKTEDKDIGKIYKRFKNEYKLPINYIELIKNDRFLNFYYNEKEINNYLQKWMENIDVEFIPYTESEFKFYMNLCLENQYINDIQENHYIDNGCFCQYCKNKRKEIFFKAKSGETIFEKIVHTEVINEVKIEKINEIKSKIKNLIDTKISRSKFKPKQFKINVSNK